MSIFSKVQNTKVGSNIFDLTHDKKLSTKMGQLTPIMAMDCVPGDHVKIDPSVLVRFAPMISPPMHRVSVYVHFFFVPNRIIWKNWENFITGGEDGQDNSVPPYFELSTNSEGLGSLSDYMGIPVNNTAIEKWSALPFAAYQKVYNEYYRDQNLALKVEDECQDGKQTGSKVVQLRALRKRAWQHDYFTSALPWTQKGDEILVPLGDQAPVVAHDPTIHDNTQNLKDMAGDPLDLALPYQKTSGTPTPGIHGNYQTGLPNFEDGSDITAYLDLEDSHYADLTQATQVSIIELRRAFQLQEWLEKNARGGSRYIESNKVHFGVNSSDQRLQRPEFLGGISSPVKISEVLQTAPPTQASSGGTPAGNMSGHGISIGSGGKVGKYCEEHGYIIGIMSIMPMTAYQQGIPRHLSRFDRYDYFWPTLQNIGEQAVLNKELYVDNDGNNDEVFGYTPRYAEYKYIQSSVHGDFRTSLDHWHMGRKFATRPNLNQDFIEMDDQEVDRIFAVQDGSDNMWCHVLNKVSARRKMAVYSSPRI